MCHNGDSLSARFTTVVSVFLCEAAVVSESVVVCLQVIVCQAKNEVTEFCPPPVIFHD